MTEQPQDEQLSYIHTYNRTLLNRVASFGAHIIYDSDIWLVLWGDVAIADDYDLETVLVLALEWIAAQQKTMKEETND